MSQRGRFRMLAGGDLGFLLVLLLGSAQGTKELEPVFRALGGSVDLGFCFGVNYMACYKLSGENKTLLGNYSARDGTRRIHEGYRGRIKFTQQHETLLGVQISNLSYSDSGVYLRECWQDNMPTTQLESYLLVCGTQVATQKVNLTEDGDASVACGASSAKRGNTFRWYRELQASYRTSLFLNTGVSLQPVEETMSPLVEVKDAGASLVLSTEVIRESRNFHCLSMDGEKCSSFQNIQLSDIEEPDIKMVYRSAGEKVVLPCPSDHPSHKHQYWESPLGKISHSEKGKDVAEENQLSLSESGNFSLVISSFSQKHSGEYKCYNPLLVAEYSLVFCSEFVSNKVHYSPGDRVVLPCALKDVSRAVITQWFYQPSPDREVLIADSGDKPAVTSEFKDRAKLSKDFSLTLSKLASQDNGTYWCVVLEDDDEDNYDYDGVLNTSEDSDRDEEYHDDDSDYNDEWPDQEEDKCISRQVTQLLYMQSRRITVTTSAPPQVATVLPKTNTVVVGSVTGLVVALIAAVVVGIVVFKLKAKKKASQNVKLSVQEEVTFMPEQNKP